MPKRGRPPAYNADEKRLAEGYLSLSRSVPSVELIHSLGRNLHRAQLTADQLIAAVTVRAPRLSSAPGPGFWFTVANQLANGELLAHPHADRLAREARDAHQAAICPECHSVTSPGEVLLDDDGTVYRFQDSRWQDETWLTRPGRTIPCPTCVKP